MDGGKISELGDSENWHHLYTLLHSLLTGWPPELWLQDSLANVSSAFTLVTWMRTHVTEASAGASEWVEHQTQYGVCKEPQAGTGKAEAWRKRAMSWPHREADGGQGTSLSSATQEPEAASATHFFPITFLCRKTGLGKSLKSVLTLTDFKSERALKNIGRRLGEGAVFLLMSTRTPQDDSWASAVDMSTALPPLSTVLTCPVSLYSETSVLTTAAIHGVVK